ncbi:DUF6584 family protein [Kitasatospora griseola]|uniref:DUF6584 family protein n=1 Tax=Kitasatospora griseola TaxID=2064 RepID=UPI000698A979|nr:DUF6584 family protein [Kitasatospora griseola]
MARQRLRSLVEHCPTDLTVRRRPAAVYRLYGEPAEAGRRNCLDESADPAETAAFEARHPDPLRRMTALFRRAPRSTPRRRRPGPGSPPSAGRPSAATAARSTGPICPPPRRTRSRRTSRGTSSCPAVAAVLLAPAVIGAVTTVRWLL